MGGEYYPNIPPISFFNVGNRRIGVKEQSIRNETKFGVKQKKWSKLRNNNGGREMVKLQVDIGMLTLVTPSPSFERGKQ